LERQKNWLCKKEKRETRVGKWKKWWTK